MIPQAVNNKKIASQFQYCRIRPPITGPAIGTTDVIKTNKAIKRVNSLPLCVSLAIERLNTIQPAPATPCTKRHTRNSVNVAAVPHKNEAIAKPIKDTITGLRRPTPSLQGPIKTCPKARPIKQVVKLSWPPDAVVPKSRAIVGKPGK